MVTAQQTSPRPKADPNAGPSTPVNKIPAVLAHESREQYEQLAASYHAQFKPQNEHENFLVGDMIQSRWKLARIERLEAAAFDQILAEPAATPNPDNAILHAITQSRDALSTLERLAAAAKRAYFKAHSEFHRSRKGAAKNSTAALNALINDFCNAPPPPPAPDPWIFQNEPNSHATPILGATFTSPANPSSAQRSRDGME